MTSNITVHGQNGRIFHVHGDDAGAEGVVLGEDQVKDAHFGEVKVITRSPARMDGGQFRGIKREIWQMSFGFEVADEKYDPRWDSFDRTFSDFLGCFGYAPDQYDDTPLIGRVEWEADRGTRYVEVFRSEQPEFDPAVDSLVRGYGNLTMHLNNYHACWFGDRRVAQWSTGQAGTSTGFVEVSNPTPMPIMQKWVVTRGDWTLPDMALRGKPGKRVPAGKYATRTLRLPSCTNATGGITVDLDGSQLMVRDAANTNIIGRMPVPGSYFMHAIPPYTPRTKLPVKVENAPAGGAMVQCILQHRWETPYGGEL